MHGASLRNGAATELGRCARLPGVGRVCCGAWLPPIKAVHSRDRSAIRRSTCARYSSVAPAATVSRMAEGVGLRYIGGERILGRLFEQVRIWGPVVMLGVNRGG